MAFLEAERSALDETLPGLDTRLRELAFPALERPGSPGIAAFRDHGGPALLIPADLGGLGADPVQAVRIQRALGSRSPSLAIASTMHNFSVATLVEYTLYGEETLAILREIARHRLFVASGFAEGRPGASILEPRMRAMPIDGGFLVSGSKKPCSLSRSMDLLTASVGVPDGSGNGYRRAVAIIPASAGGIDRRPFWRSEVLAGAESDELVLDRVEIPAEALFFPAVEGTVDPVEAGGFCWFELLVSASYLGAGSALVERALAQSRGHALERAQLGIELEGAMLALERVAQRMGDGTRSESILAGALMARFAVQRALERAVPLAAELLGGIAFIGAPEVAYLQAASRALAFHPPSRHSIAESLAGYLAGAPLQVV